MFGCISSLSIRRQDFPVLHDRTLFPRPLGSGSARAITGFRPALAAARDGFVFK